MTIVGILHFKAQIRSLENAKDAVTGDSKRNGNRVVFSDLSCAIAWLWKVGLLTSSNTNTELTAFLGNCCP